MKSNWIRRILKTDDGYNAPFYRKITYLGFLNPRYKTFSTIRIIIILLAIALITFWLLTQ